MILFRLVDLEDVCNGFELKELNMAALYRAMETNRLTDSSEKKNKPRYSGRLTTKKHRNPKRRKAKAR